MSSKETELAWLGLGSNQGNRLQLLRHALEMLRTRGMPPGSCSAVYETDPVDYLEQAAFLNMVCSVPILPSPADLLRLCKEIERRLGRTAGRPKGPRPIDLDILFYGSRIVNTRELTIPHPAFRERKFVLEPLAEVAPRLIDPITGKSVEQLLEACPDRGDVHLRHPPLCS